MKGEIKERRGGSKRLLSVEKGREVGRREGEML